MYGPIGWYADCDDAVCSDCMHEEPTEETTLEPKSVYLYTATGEEWQGFESWDEPLAIFADTESDTPTHCSVCEGLIEHALTPEGYRYVTDALLGALSASWPYKAEAIPGRLCILKQWYAEYADGIQDTIQERIEAWPDRDAFSPKREEA